MHNTRKRKLTLSLLLLAALSSAMSGGCGGGWGDEAGYVSGMPYFAEPSTQMKPATPPADNSANESGATLDTTSGFNAQKFDGPWRLNNSKSRTVSAAQFTFSDISNSSSGGGFTTTLDGSFTPNSGTRRSFDPANGHTTLDFYRSFDVQPGIRAYEFTASIVDNEDPAAKLLLGYFVCENYTETAYFEYYVRGSSIACGNLDRGSPDSSTPVPTPTPTPAPSTPEEAAAAARNLSGHWVGTSGTGTGTIWYSGYEIPITAVLKRYEAWLTVRVDSGNSLVMDFGPEIVTYTVTGPVPPPYVGILGPTYTEEFNDSFNEKSTVTLENLGNNKYRWSYRDDGYEEIRNVTIISDTEALVEGTASESYGGDRSVINFSGRLVKQP